MKKSASRLSIPKLDKEDQDTVSIEPNSDTEVERLTPEELRKFPGCEHYTDEQAKEVTETLHRLSEILYDLVMLEKLQCTEGHTESIVPITEDDNISNLNIAA